MGDHSIPKDQPWRRPGSALWRCEQMGHEGGRDLLSRAKVTGDPSAKGRATKVSKVGRGLPY